MVFHWHGPERCYRGPPVGQSAWDTGHRLRGAQQCGYIDVSLTCLG